MSQTTLNLVNLSIQSFIIYTYFNRMLSGKKKKVNTVLYIVLIIVFEKAMCEFNDFLNPPLSTPQMILSTCLSIIKNTIYCSLNEGIILQYVFVLVAYEALLFLSEGITSVIAFSFIIENENNISEIQLEFISFISELIFLVIVIIISTIWKRRVNSTLYMRYSFSYLLTPIISIIIISSITQKADIFYQNNTTIVTILACLALLNVTNYILINRLSTYWSVKKQNDLIGVQLEFQKEKYQQLSTSYRDTRRLVHDTNKHYMTIDEFIKKEEYEKLHKYIERATNELNLNFAKYNTGNLVIDSFLSNYESRAKANHIDFSAEVAVKSNNITVDDYDLCVILGNLLDNGLNACNNNSGSNRCFSIKLLIDNGKRLIICTTNPYSEIQKNHDDMHHGFGIENIKKTIEKYNGIMEITETDTFNVYIIIPIIKCKDGSTPPKKHLN